MSKFVPRNAAELLCAHYLSFLVLIIPTIHKRGHCPWPVEPELFSLSLVASSSPQCTEWKKASTSIFHRICTIATNRHAPHSVQRHLSTTYQSTFTMIPFPPPLLHVHLPAPTRWGSFLLSNTHLFAQRPPIRSPTSSCTKRWVLAASVVCI